MKRTALRLLALSSALASAASCANAATSPRYGGTLRVELRQSSVTFDPREWRAGSRDAAADEKLAALLFDRLVALDNYGRIQPQLATEWSHDAAFKRWQFTIRPGVKLSDGSALTAAEVAAALQPLLGANRSILASGNYVILQSQTPAPDLLEEISSGRYFIYRAQADGRLLGTGPFFVAESAQSPTDGRVTFYKLAANDSCWAGKPFLDAIQLTLNVPALRALFDLQLGRADLIELAPELVRRAAQDNLRVWSSDPLRLFALRFDETQPAASDSRLREALSFSLDRNTMAGVLLQKQAQPAAALLPQWLSGYAFLFTVETNLNHAKEIRAALPANAAAGADPLHLRVDAPSDIAKLLGERVAVNARQASIAVQMSNRPASRPSVQGKTNVETAAADPPAGLHLVEWNYSSLSPRAELESLVSALLPAVAAEAANAGSTPEQLYAVEKRLLDERRILPLVTLPEFAAVGRDVRNWSPSRWADWHLEQVWLDRPEIPAEHSGVQLPANEPAASSVKLQPPQPAAANGAHP
jgi:peptide/nickel transport system substrate-binding protein